MLEIINSLHFWQKIVFDYLSHYKVFPSSMAAVITSWTKLHSKIRDVNSPKCNTTIHGCGLKVSRSPVQLYIIFNKVTQTWAPISVSNTILTHWSNLATSRVERLNAEILITSNQCSSCRAFWIIKSEFYLLYSNHDNTILNYILVRNHERADGKLAITAPNETVPILQLKDSYPM